MAYQPIVLGSNLIPDGALGALPGGDYSSPDEDRTAVVTNEDGTITVPTYQLQSNTPTFDLEEMQNVYGTKYMPMFRWISQNQTGEVTFDPEEDQISEEEAARLSADFADETGMSAEEAMREQYKQEGIAAVTQVAAGLGGQFGRSVAAAGGVDKFSEGFTDFTSNFDSPLDIFKTPKDGSSSYVQFSPDTKNANLAAGKGTITGADAAEIQNQLKDPAFLERLNVQGNSADAIEMRQTAQQQKITAENAIKPLTGTGVKGYFGGVTDRLGFGGEDGGLSAAGRSNLYGSAGVGLATVAANLIAGKNLKESIKTGAKVGFGSYIGNALLPGIGGFIGGAIGGRVICNELMRQGIMTRKQVILDYKFTEDYLTPQHVAGYHVWAVWMVRQMRKGRLVNFWTHVAGHRANEIAYIYGKRDKPDYLGKVYRKILEPICWSVGLFCKTTDWTVLYKQKEI